MSNVKSNNNFNDQGVATSKGYDLIGDIHGHADELTALLDLMDYRLMAGCYRHPERTVIFLGDFIDRGPKQREVLNIVMPMVKYGKARAVMGNHEFNALAFHTSDPQNSDSWLRLHADKNIKQHKAFLDEYSGREHQSELEEVLDFFWSLPLWIDLDGISVVHACWENRYINALGNAYLTPNRLVAASTKGTLEYNAIEALLKGIEHPLPDGVSFKDKGGHARTNVRIKWWVNKDSRLGDITMPSSILDGSGVENDIISADQLHGYRKECKPVFIGHYWMNMKDGEPTLLADNVACIDYSVAGNGKLVAYRWSGEELLSESNFIYVK